MTLHLLHVDSCEQLAVQVPPTLTWGMEFLLSPFEIRNTGQVYKIVAAEENTTISFVVSGSEEATSANIPMAGGNYTLNTTSDSFCYLTSDKPIFVAQFAKGGSMQSGSGGIGDPVMLIVSPTHMYVNSTTFITLDSQFTQHTISVTVTNGDSFNPNSVLFDNEPLDCTWELIMSTNGSTVGWGCTFTNSTNNS